MNPNRKKTSSQHTTKPSLLKRLFTKKCPVEKIVEPNEPKPKQKEQQRQSKDSFDDINSSLNRIPKDIARAEPKQKEKPQLPQSKSAFSSLNKTTKEIRPDEQKQKQPQSKDIIDDINSSLSRTTKSIAPYEPNQKQQPQSKDTFDDNNVSLNRKTKSIAPYEPKQKQQPQSTDTLDDINSSLRRTSQDININSRNQYIERRKESSTVQEHNWEELDPTPPGLGILMPTAPQLLMVNRTNLTAEECAELDSQPYYGNIDLGKLKKIKDRLVFAAKKEEMDQLANMINARSVSTSQLSDDDIEYEKQAKLYRFSVYQSNRNSYSYYKKGDPEWEQVLEYQDEIRFFEEHPVKMEEKQTQYEEQPINEMSTL